MQSLAVPPSLVPPHSAELSSSNGFSLDDAAMKNLLRDLHRASRWVYWVDLLATSLIGWGGFAGAVMLRPFSAGMIGCLLIGACALYRGLCFMHELTHQSARTLPGFESAWNWLVGFPLLMPSFIYVGVHQDHHRLTSYGTDKDPEYMPFAHSAVRTAVFACESVLIPVALLVRFLVLAPIGLLLPAFQRGLVRCGSALTMNVHYRREVTPELMGKVQRDTLFVLALWSAVIALAAAGILPVRLFAVWLATDALISFVNTLRTLGAHAYESEGAPLDRTGQLLDSIDTPGAFWTELWAPVGLRYHALHHYLPGIPYHNLPEAYRRAISHLPVADAYKQMSSPSLLVSLRNLLCKGLGSWDQSRLRLR